MKIKELCLKCIDSNSPIKEDIMLLQKAVKDDIEPESWQDAYWLAVWTYKYYNDESINDLFIIKMLEKSMSMGLNYHVDSKIFLEASMTLAKLLFKYQKYQQAENFLLLIRELTVEQNNLPNWVHQFSSVTYYKLQFNSILADPDSFFKSLALINESNEEDRSNKQSLIKDFLNTVSSYVDENNFKGEKLLPFIQKCYFWIQPYLKEVNKEWQELINSTGLLDTNIFESSNNDQWMIMQINLLKTMIEEQQNQLDELGITVESVFDKLSEQQFNKTTEQVSHPIPDASYISTSKKPKILVFGSTKISTSVMTSIAKNMGFDKTQLDFMTDYDNNKNFNFKDIRYHSPYSGILIGPVAHKIAGIGDYSSVLQMLKNEEGYPHIEEIRTIGGDLKVTKTSFKNALRKMITHLDSIGVNMS